jgi:hypothetical protein
MMMTCVISFLDIALDQAQIDHIDGHPSQSQTNSVLRQSRQAWTPFLLEQRCSSTEVGHYFRHKTYVLNSVILGEFYGQNLATTNLEIIARFFEKYPDYADKTFLSVKVQFIPHSDYT